MKTKILKKLEFLSWKDYEPVDTTPDENDLAVIASLLALDYDYRYLI